MIPENSVADEYLSLHFNENTILRIEENFPLIWQILNKNFNLNFALIMIRKIFVQFKLYWLFRNSNNIIGINMVSMTAVLVKTFYRTEINFVTLNDFWFYNWHYDVNIDLAAFIAKYLFYANMYVYSHKNIFIRLKIATMYYKIPRTEIYQSDKDYICNSNSSFMNVLNNK